jgi:hypothetical protein
MYKCTLSHFAIFIETGRSGLDLAILGNEIFLAFSTKRETPQVGLEPSDIEERRVEVTCLDHSSIRHSYILLIL